MAENVDEALLEERLTRLEEARNWRPRTISKLEVLLRSGRDEDLFRVNPVRYAADHKLDEQEAIDLFLHAAKAGLFALAWHLVCAYCGHVVESLNELSRLHAHYRCNFCSAMNEGVLDDYVQVAFTVSPEVRAISFHRPAELEIGDYCLGYHFAKGVTFANGANLAQMRDVITRWMQWIEPGERVFVETEIPPGRLAAKDLARRTSVAFFLAERGTIHEQLDVERSADGLQVVQRTLHPRRVVQSRATFEYDAALDLEGGRVTMAFTNATTERWPLWVIFLPAAFESSPVTFEPFLSGKRVLTAQTFRALFRTETFHANEGLVVRDLTFLFSDLKGSTALYEGVGDLNAFFLVRQHFEALTAAIAAHRGSMVKTIGDAVMAAFASPADAVRGARDMLDAMSRFQQAGSAPLQLKIGIHRGPSIAVTLNDQVDYFGHTVNVAARIQGIADADQIYLSASVYEDPEVQQLLGDADVRREVVRLKGVNDMVPVFQLHHGPREPPSAHPDRAHARA